jgi:hypothetical protein
MDVPTGHFGLETNVAKALLPGQAVDAALSGAEGTELQQGVGLPNAASQLALVVEFKISGGHPFSAHVIHNKRVKGRLHQPTLYSMAEEQASGETNLPFALGCGIFSKPCEGFEPLQGSPPTPYQGVPRCQSYDTTLSASVG